MSEFEKHWDFITRRTERGVVTVQDKEELGYVFNLMQGCNSYLEIGTAEGNSLYVLAQAMPKGSPITYIDYGEKHTTPPRNEILALLKDYDITAIHGDSNDYATFKGVADKRFDAVLIDAGHDAFNVAIDCLFYGPLAKKFIIFHDVQLKEVDRAFNWYCKQRPDAKRHYRVVNSESFGYGVIEL